MTKQQKLIVAFSSFFFCILLLTEIFYYQWKYFLHLPELNIGHNYNFLLKVSQNISENPYLTEGYTYYYSPLFTILFYPFILIKNTFGLLSAQLFFIAINTFVIARVFIILIRIQQIKTSFSYYIFIPFLALFCINESLFRFFVSLNINILLLWLTLEAILLSSQNSLKNDILAGILLALTINIKFLTLPFLIYFIYRKKWSVVGSCFISFFVYLFLPAIVFGWGKNIFLLTEWWGLLTSSEKGHWFYQGISGIIYYFFQRGGIELRTFPSYHHVFYQILFSCIAVAIVLTFYFLRTKPFQKSTSQQHFLWELSYIFLIIPLIYPHQQIYAYVFAIPAVFYINDYLFFLLIRKRENTANNLQRRFKSSLFNIKLFTKREWCIFLLMIIVFIFAPYRIWFHNMIFAEGILRYFTYDMLILLLVPILALCIPKKTELKQNQSSQL